MKFVFTLDDQIYADLIQIVRTRAGNGSMNKAMKAEVIERFGAFVAEKWQKSGSFVADGNPGTQTLQDKLDSINLNGG